MKRIGILFGLLLLSVCMVWAQDSSSTTTTTTTTTSDNSAQNDTLAQSDTTPKAQSDDAIKQSRKDAATQQENAADAAKQRAKDTSSPEAAERDKAIARLDDAAKSLNQLLAAPDNGIPDEVFTKAKCVAVIPSLVKGGFIFGAEHGRGVASCRTAKGWSAPAFFTVTGGSWGAQIGAEGVDLVMLIMDDNGMNQLLAAKFKVGGAVSASAGPVGRHASADTSWKMNASVLTYSRSRGLFAGATLNGTTIKEDENAMRAYYGRTVGFRPVLSGQVKDPMGNKDVFVATLAKSRAEVNAQAH
jgi:lipid-binding SYLF domain-containing protein